ncbi:MAG: hypothetical protein ACREDQ_07865 [Limisphaerales bacterium]
MLSTVAGNAQVTVQIGQNFTGSDNSQTLITPADANGAVGPNYFVEFINGSFTVYNKSDGSGVVQISDMEFWSNAGPAGGGVGGINFASSDTISDPRVIYDPVSQRWFASQVKYDGNASDPSLESDFYLLGVSDTADPSGSWHVFSFLTVTGAVQFADFPTMGVDADAVYLSGDMYHGQSNSLGTSLTMIPKADLLANPPVITNRILFKTMTYTNRGAVLQPVTCFDGSSVGKILAAGSLGDDFLFHSNLLATTMLNPGAANATLAPATNILVDEYTAPLDATQPDGTDTLADNDARFSARVYTVGGVIYAVHNTEVDGRAAIRWYRINAANYALLESGTIADANLDLFYPSIGANGNGVVVIACNGCGPGPNEFISSYAYVGQTVSGVTTYGNSILLASGSANYHDLNEQAGAAVESRWGDYSTVSVDPSDSTHFWTIQMLPVYDADLDLFGNGDAVVWQTQITELITSLPSPQLFIMLAGKNATVSWSSSAAGYQLQSATNLTASTVWSNVTQTLSTNGGTISVVIPASSSRQFFRLQK